MFAAARCVYMVYALTQLAQDPYATRELDRSLEVSRDLFSDQCYIAAIYNERAV